MLYKRHTIVTLNAVTLDVTWTWKNRTQKLLRNLIMLYCVLIEDEEIVIACGNSTLNSKEIPEFCLLLVMLSFLCKKICPLFNP